MAERKKEQIIAQLHDRLMTAQAVIIAENTGLTAIQMADLRHRLRDCDAAAQVVKNTLVKISVANTPFAPLSEKLSGALIYGIGGDPSSMAKVFSETAKKNNKLIIRGGALAHSGNLDDAAIWTLAALPGRMELLSRLAATTASPISGFLRQLNEFPASFARALAAIRDKKKTKFCNHNRRKSDEQS